VFLLLKTFSLLLQRIAPGPGLDFARNILFRSVNDKLLGTGISSIILGGSHTSRKSLRLLSALGYYTVCGFGMTETAITSVETAMRLSTRISGAVGMPLDSCEYKLSEQGEMALRSRTLHTERLIDGCSAPPDTDEEGFYHTGDIVSLSRGRRMHVKGRVKDVIINESGENVYPDDLEDIFSSLPGTDQHCVLGVPEEQRGKRSPYEQITLVLCVGERLDDSILTESLRAAVVKRNASLPVYKRVSKVYLTGDRLPVANGIKVKRAELKMTLISQRKRFKAMDLKPAAFTAEDAADAQKPQDDEKEAIRSAVCEIYAETLNLSVSEVGDDAHFLDDLGGDSLQVLSIAAKVEEYFGVLIPTEDYSRCTTVSQMTELLFEELNDIRHPIKRGVNVMPISRFEDTEEYKAFAARHEALMASGTANPYFVCHDSPLTDKSVMSGREVLNFGSYNYAGMSGRKEVTAAAVKAAERYGTSASGSRLLAGEKHLYQELEAGIAEWKHAEAAMVLVGGHSTNVSLIGHFCTENDLIVYDALAHNSIEQGCRLSRAVSKPFPHNDPAALDHILRIQRAKFAKTLIVIEGAYSMDGDIADVPAFVKLKETYGCFLMVDEAHSACVIGPTGGGVDEYFGLAPRDIDIKMGTLSKGLGACGGYLAGDRTLIEYLKYSLPGFVFSVGISPPLAAAVMEAIKLLQNDPTIMLRLKRNIRSFVTEAHARGLNTCLARETAIIPVLIGADETAFRLSNLMRENGIFVPPAVFPAVPKGKARLRFCVTSEHQPDQIVMALDTLMSIADREGIRLN
jgi:8-amino-7-oxononanoate synthase/acyl carrier protein